MSRSALFVVRVRSRPKQLVERAGPGRLRFRTARRSARRPFARVEQREALNKRLFGGRARQRRIGTVPNFGLLETPESGTTI